MLNIPNLSEYDDFKDYFKSFSLKVNRLIFSNGTTWIEYSICGEIRMMRKDSFNVRFLSIERLRVYQINQILNE